MNKLDQGLADIGCKLASMINELLFLDQKNPLKHCRQISLSSKI
ncbi:MAG: hypothetical protein VX642_00595 [Bdellovibrionota bacterium]|nr:hypothetical protein [Bdellovibrionota bacterium]